MKGFDDIAMKRALHGPGWREKEARSYATGSGPISLPADPLSREFADYLARRFEGRVRRGARDRDFDAAEALWENPAKREMLMALVLAKVPTAEIAARLETSASVIAALEAIRFDVRDCLHAPSWVRAHVFGPLEQAGEYDVLVRLKYAYCGGPAYVAALLDGEGPLPNDEVERLVDLDAKLFVKLSVALAAPLGDESQRNAFFKTATRYLSQKARLDLERDKFLFRVERARRARGESAASALTVAAGDRDSVERLERTLSEGVASMLDAAGETDGASSSRPDHRVA